VDLALSIYLALRWVDGPVKRKWTDNNVPGSAICRGSVSFLYLFSQVGSFLLSFRCVTEIDF
jgi:hypothetical protein